MPSTLTVTNNLDSGAGSLRAEIAAAQSGDTIDFASSVGNITLTSGELVINKSLTIQGPGAGLLTINGGGGCGCFAGGIGGNSRVFEVDGAGSNVSLSGLTLSRGGAVAVSGVANANDGEGGAILNFGTLTVSNCWVSGNLANDGGGIYNAGSLTVSNNSLLESDTASYDGGSVYNANKGTATITGGAITQNTANDGGGVYNDGSMTLSGCWVFSNQAQDLGGGIYNSLQGHLTIQQSSIVGNYDGTGANDIWNFGHVKISSDSYVGTIVSE